MRCRGSSPSVQPSRPGDEQPPDRSSTTGHSFRPIHYLGSKLRLSGLIVDAMSEVARPGPFVDLFAGSGTVSLALSREREVIAVDIQEYSRVLCSAILRPSCERYDIVERARRSPRYEELRHAVEPLARHEDECAAAAESGELEPLCELVEKASLLAFMTGQLSEVSTPLHAALSESARRLVAAGLDGDVRSLVTRYFGGPYFSFAQAAELDALLEVVHGLSGHARDHYLAITLSAASEVVNTVGKQFAQPLRPRDSRGRPKPHLARLVARDRFRSPFDAFTAWTERYDALPIGSRRHRVARLDYRDFLRTCSREVGAVYADPPYTRDHYSRYYHVLETMCLRDNPEVSTMRLGGAELLSRGLYRRERHQSPFCIKSQAPGAFEGLLRGVAGLGAPLVLSYSPYRADERARPRLLKVDDIVALARQTFRDVQVRSVGKYAHNKLNHQELNTKVFYDSEVLIVCQRPS